METFFPHGQLQQRTAQVAVDSQMAPPERISERIVNENGGVCVETLVPQAGQGFDAAGAGINPAGQGHDAAGAGFDPAGQGYDTRYVGVELVPQERVQLRTGARVGQLVLNAPVLQMSEEDSLLIARSKISFIPE